MRLTLVRALLRRGRVGRSLALAVMRPPDLLELNRLHYSQPDVVGLLSAESYVDSGLTPNEEALYERLPFRQGRLLNLEAGAGREAVALARRGFEVTCIDFTPELAERTRANAARHGLALLALTQEVTALDVPPGSFDIVWLTSQMYSSIPGRAGRMRLLAGIARALKPAGVFACQFRWQGSVSRIGFGGRVRQFAALVGGNPTYQNGDELLGGLEFAHCFSTEPELRLELTSDGLLDVLDLWFDDDHWCGSALLVSSRAAGRGGTGSPHA